MSARGVITPARPRRVRSRAILLAALLVTTGLVPLVTTSSLPASAASSDTSTTLTDPKASGVSVVVTPPVKDVREGDSVHLHYAGFEPGEYLISLGTCPVGLPVAKMATDSFVGQLACSSQFPTGLTGDVDPTSLNTPGLSTQVNRAYPAKDGTLDVTYLVGQGHSVGSFGYQVVLKNGTRQSFPSLDCTDAADQHCVIGFAVQRKDGTSWTDLTSLEISPAPKVGTDTRGCTGLSATSTISATGPERLQDPLAALDRAYCGTTPSPIPVSYVPTSLGEGDPSSVAAVGSTNDLAFIGSPALTKTPLTAGQLRVPVALDAVSVAQLGGLTQPAQTTGQTAYTTLNPSLALSNDDVAKLLLHAFPTAIPAELPTTPAAGAAYNPLAAEIRSRPGNTDLLSTVDASNVGFPFVVAPTVTYSVGEDSTAIALSSLLAASAPAAWTFPANAVNTDLKRSGKAVGPITDFGAIVDHSSVATGSILTSQTSSVSGLYAAKISKDITTGSYSQLCPNFASTSGGAPPWQVALTKGCVRFAVMDTATAASISVPSARLASGSGFVAPSTDSLQKAAASPVGAGGYFPTTDPTAYPLTFVEYAVVPLAPLLGDSCQQRGQQAALKSFLAYAVGDGQKQLPAGLAPLTDVLRAEAAAAIAKIGTGTPTGACAPKPTPKPTPTPTTAPTPPVASSPPDIGTGTVVGGTSSGSSGSTGSTTPQPVATTPVSQTAANIASSNAERPSPVAAKPVAFEAAQFQGAARTSPTSSVVGLLGLLVLLSLGAAWASGTLGLSRIRDAVRRGSAS